LPCLVDEDRGWELAGARENRGEGGGGVKAERERWQVLNFVNVYIPWALWLDFISFSVFSCPFKEIVKFKITDPRWWIILRHSSSY